MAAKETPYKAYDSRQPDPWCHIIVSCDNSTVKCKPAHCHNFLMGINILKLSKMLLYTKGQEMQLPLHLEGLT